MSEDEPTPSGTPLVTLGVIADTHIPDRAHQLDMRIIPVFRQANVQAILHAGDISSARVLDELSEIGKVYAVSGNRDWIWLRGLPSSIQMEIAGVSIVLTHGHGNWLDYLVDRLYYTVYGYRFERYRMRLQARFPGAKALVFGHTHRCTNMWVNGQLLFNPGSAHFPDDPTQSPTIGLLLIYPGGRIEGKIIALDD